MINVPTNAAETALNKILFVRYITIPLKLNYETFTQAEVTYYQATLWIYNNIEPFLCVK